MKEHKSGLQGFLYYITNWKKWMENVHYFEGGKVGAKNKSD